VAAGYAGRVLAHAFHDAPWREPIEVLDGLAEEPWTIGFLSGGAGRWSYVGARPDAVLTLYADDPRDPFTTLAAFAGPAAPGHPDGPPFQGGVAGVLCYELADRIERLDLARLDDWPDLACARYPAWLAFDHDARRLVAVGRGATQGEADERARQALSWLSCPAGDPPARGGALMPDQGDAYETAVAEVVARIRAGEIFQANVARRWRGRLPDAGRPFDLLAALARTSPAPFASYLRLEDRAVVSNSPERFLQMAAGAVRTEPIKGTARRGATAGEDTAAAAALERSAKDRAENLMIVDLMRNDLSRVCAPGSVKTPELFRLATFANVHHLVSTVIGRLTAARGAADLLRAAFPAGSITGAPKVQAMKVIRQLEAPRGPFFGSMFHLGFDGALDSSVLIRTAAFRRDASGWAVEARAGAGIVADSDPAQERAETEAKISALAGALLNP
jgi:para-aminobenzoate synthetase component 1